MIIVITCTSCKADKHYLVRDYLNDLALKSGISTGEDIDETVSKLICWGIIKEDDKKYLNDTLTYGYLINTINSLLNNEINIRDNGWLKNKFDENSYVSKDVAVEIIDKAVYEINNKEFIRDYNFETINDYIELDNYNYNSEILYVDVAINIGDILYLSRDDVFVKVENIEADYYIVKELSFEEIYKQLNMQDSYEIDFNNVEDIPGGELVEDDTLYINETRKLLSSTNKSKVFLTDGFRVSYSLKRNGLDARISKKIKGINVFFDISLSNIKPSYKWKYIDGKVEEAYFKVNYNSVSELGCSIGKYNNYYLDFKDKDSKSFPEGLKAIIKTEEDEVETTIKICEIKTPIKEIPTAYFNIDIYARIYTTGKVEILFTNAKCIGFESKNGSIRLIDDEKKDSDFIIGGSSKATIGLNFNIESVKKRLMDLEIDVGIRAAVSTTMHLYDKDGNEEIIKSEYPYFVVDEVSKENNNIKVCGDVSLNWILDVKFNTSKTLLYKFGLSKTKSILDSDNQVFNNKTHLENGVFVKKCTRKKPQVISNNSEDKDNKVDKIILSKYSKVININEIYSIPIKSLPSGYETKDLKYESMDEEIVKVDSNGNVYGKKMGACEVKISTIDNKHFASIDILVSSGK